MISIKLTSYTPKQKLWFSGRQSTGLMIRRSRGFDPRPILDGSGVKAMPGMISTPNSDSLQKNKKIQVAKWGTPKKTSYTPSYNEMV